MAEYAYDAWGACTILSDTSGRNIATLNPFRYRGYYYDTETGLSYLQSRYYDPTTGRFINADDAEIIKAEKITTNCNLLSYCYNNPINQVDFCGGLVASTIAKIVLGALFGVLVQLLADLVVYVFRCLVEGRKLSFKISPGDYVGSALTWALASVNPFGSKYKILAKLFNFVPVIAKYACKLICGERINIFDLLTDLLSVIISIVLSSAVNSNTAKQIKNLKKLNRSKLKSPGFKFEKLQIKVSGKILTQNITVILNFSPTLLQTIYHCIVGV